jgi:hypothetical protein
MYSTRHQYGVRMTLTSTPMDDKGRSGAAPHLPLVILHTKQNIQGGVRMTLTSMPYTPDVKGRSGAAPYPSSEILHT